MKETGDRFRVHVLGMGNFFTERYNHPCFLVEAGDRFLMLDAPANIPKVLASYRNALWGRNGPYDGDVSRFVLDNVNTFAITHAHIDHGSGVRTIALWKFYKEMRRRPRLDERIIEELQGKLPKAGQRAQLIAHPEVKHELEKESINKLKSSELFEGELNFSDYFRSHLRRPGGSVDLGGGLEVVLTDCDHAVPTTGFLVRYAGKSLWYTGDTRFHDGFMLRYAGSDMIIADCSAVRAGGHGVKEDFLGLGDVLDKTYFYHVADSMIRVRDVNGEIGWFVEDTPLKVLKQYAFYDI